MKLELKPCPMPRKMVKHNYFLSDTLAPKESYGHRPLITAFPPCPDSYRECAAITVLALAEPFIAAGAAVGLFAVFYCFLKVLMVSSYRLGIGTFLPVRTDSSGRATEKELSLRGYEREKHQNN